MLKIEINCSPEEVDDHMAALGFERRWANPFSQPPNDAPLDLAAEFDKQPAPIDLPAMGDAIHRAQDAFVAMTGASPDESRAVVENVEHPAETVVAEPEPAHDHLEPAPGFHPSGRRVGKAADGRNRRNAAEVAEDKAYELAHPELFAKPPAPEKPKAEAPPIEPPVVSDADAALDEQDEADESAANRQGAELTLEDVRDAIGRYQKRFGNAEAIKNIPALIGSTVIEIPKTQTALKAAIDKIDGAIAAETGLFERAARTSDRAAVVEAVNQYGLKYDGKRDDLEKMPNTVADMPKVLQAEFGTGVSTLGKIKDDPVAWGRALTAVELAIADNPFKRVARS